MTRMAIPPLVERIRDEGPDRRRQFIVDTFIAAYPELMRADPDAWRGKFRKMAGSAFAYYRGSAAGYYADVAGETDAFTNEKTGRVWIQGDLHAENFGTYMNSAGVLVFDVNDFDEAYVGPFTWDLKRLAASLTLIGYEKALSDGEIAVVLEALASSYAQQIAVFASDRSHSEFALTLVNTDGKLLQVLRSARLLTHVGVLQALTTVENFERRFSVNAATESSMPPPARRSRTPFADISRRSRPGSGSGSPRTTSRTSWGGGESGSGAPVDPPTRSSSKDPLRPWRTTGSST